MNLPLRIQLSRSKGWRMPANTVKVDRGTRWGNPFRPGVDGTVEECLELYRKQVADDPELAMLRGKNLACWCKAGALCHADILLELANGGTGPR